MSGVHTALCVAASNDRLGDADPSDCLSPHSHAGTPAQARISCGSRQPAAGSDSGGGQSHNFLSRFKQLFEALAVPWLCELRNLHELNYSKNKPKTDRRVVQNIDFI